jgi:hypothetical protein
MRYRSLVSVGALAITMAVALTTVPLAGQSRPATAPTAPKAPAPKTAWGEPDIQGIWTYEYQVPFQRPEKYKDREFFTDAEIAELDKQRAAQQSRDYRAERGSEADVAGAYNAVFLTLKHSGRRTSMVTDPPNGRIPPTTPEFQKRQTVDRDFALALLAPTEPCRLQLQGCAGGKFGPPSPRRNEVPPSYLAGAINRNFNPEDRSLGERCLLGQLPEFGTAFGGSYRRIVQTPGGVTIFYDQGQGQGFQRNIVMNGSPHLPASIRQWWGDSRGHWEGNTLVIDVTNFSEKANFQGAHENLHLVERWTRTDAATLDYVVTIEDSTVWTKPFTVTQEFTAQDNEANRIYYEPRCHEGNFGLPGMLLGARMEETAFAEGRGVDPATKCTAACTFGPSEETADPLQ